MHLCAGGDKNEGHKQYLRARDDLVNCRLSVETALLKSKGEESGEVLEATKMRDTTYQEYLSASKKLLEACNAENGLIGRVQQRADLNGLDGIVVSYQPSTKRFAVRVASVDSLLAVKQEHLELKDEVAQAPIAHEIGVEVVFKGLMGRADLNGLDGTVVSYPSGSPVQNNSR